MPYGMPVRSGPEAIGSSPTVPSQFPPSDYRPPTRHIQPGCLIRYSALGVTPLSILQPPEDVDPADGFLGWSCLAGDCCRGSLVTLGGGAS